MHTLFVMDPLDRIDVAGDSTYLLMLESCRRGFPIAWCEPQDLFVDDQRACGRVQPVRVNESAPHFESEPSRVVALSDFDCIWMRKDPPFDMDYVFTTYILDLVTPHALVLNDPRSIKLSNEKMVALQWPELSPPTMVTNRKADVDAFAARHPRIVLKPWDGNGGRGVVVTQAGDKNLGALVGLLTDEGRAYTIAQAYLPEITTGDKRIILIDGEPMGWFIRIPGKDDHRGNMHVGASVEACELSPRDREICAAIGPRLKREGLLFVGIDVIGDHLTEINVTSPTGLHEVRELQGPRLERDIIDRALARREEQTP